MKNLIGAFVALSFVTSANAALVLDRGVVGTGITVTAAGWTNESFGQNFADKFVLSSNTTVLAYRHYSLFAPSSLGGTSLNIRLYADSAGSPGALLSTQTVSYVASNYVGNFFSSTVNQNEDIYSYDFNLTSGLALNAGTTYWIGAAGNGFDFPQAGTNGWDDNSMAQFNSTSFLFNTGSAVGDQAFQLYDEAVPEPATMAILGAGALALLRRRKK